MSRYEALNAMTTDLFNVNIFFLLPLSAFFDPFLSLSPFHIPLTPLFSLFPSISLLPSSPPSPLPAPIRAGTSKSFGQCENMGDQARRLRAIQTGIQIHRQKVSTYR